MFVVKTRKNKKKTNKQFYAKMPISFQEEIKEIGLSNGIPLRKLVFDNLRELTLSDVRDGLHDWIEFVFLKKHDGELKRLMIAYSNEQEYRDVEKVIEKLKIFGKPSSIGISFAVYKKIIEKYS